MEDNEEADVSPQKGKTEPSNGLNLSLLMRLCGTWNDISFALIILFCIAGLGHSDIAPTWRFMDGRDEGLSQVAWAYLLAAVMTMTAFVFELTTVLVEYSRLAALAWFLPSLNDGQCSKSKRLELGIPPFRLIRTCRENRRQVHWIIETVTETEVKCLKTTRGVSLPYKMKSQDLDEEEEEENSTLAAEMVAVRAGSMSQKSHESQKSGTRRRKKTPDLASKEPEIAERHFTAHSKASDSSLETATMSNTFSAEADAPTILCVDDDPVHLDVVYAVADGEQAVQFLKMRSVQLMMLDVMMPGMSGQRVLRSVRKFYTSEQLPIIIVSAVCRQETVSEFAKLGANDYIMKPFGRAELLEHVQLHLSKATQARVSRKARELKVRFLQKLIDASCPHVSQSRVTGFVRHPHLMRGIRCRPHGLVYKGEGRSYVKGEGAYGQIEMKPWSGLKPCSDFPAAEHMLMGAFEDKELRVSKAEAEAMGLLQSVGRITVCCRKRRIALETELQNKNGTLLSDEQLKFLQASYARQKVLHQHHEGMAAQIQRLELLQKSQHKLLSARTEQDLDGLLQIASSGPGRGPGSQAPLADPKLLQIRKVEDNVGYYLTSIDQLATRLPASSKEELQRIAYQLRAETNKLLMEMGLKCHELASADSMLQHQWLQLQRSVPQLSLGTDPFLASLTLWPPTQTPGAAASESTV
ncbi:gtcR [Symbiodinium sp. CCMP2456]|nr:gtcR [Symbiodinium sp. CCMP2456]